jgi:hypothetical protein
MFHDVGFKFLKSVIAKASQQQEDRTAQTHPDVQLPTQILDSTEKSAQIA